MVKWQYKLLLGNGRKVEEQMNLLGAEGWEFAAMYVNPFNCAILMKRQLGVAQ